MLLIIASQVNFFFLDVRFCANCTPQPPHLFQAQKYNQTSKEREPQHSGAKFIFVAGWRVAVELEGPTRVHEAGVEEHRESNQCKKGARVGGTLLAVDPKVQTRKGVLLLKLRVQADSEQSNENRCVEPLDECPFVGKVLRR